MKLNYFLLALLIFFFAPPLKSLNYLRPNLEVSVEESLSDLESGLFPGIRSETLVQRYFGDNSYHLWAGRNKNEIVFYKLRDFEYSNFLSMETLIDGENEISFRLVRLYYDFTIALKWKLKEGLLSLNYSHKCSHGVDSLGGRITIDSGPEIRFRRDIFLSSSKLRAGFSFKAILIGQNKDFDAQTRFASQGSFRLIPAFSGDRWFIEYAANLFWLSSGDNENYMLYDSIKLEAIEQKNSFSLGYAINAKRRLNTEISLSYRETLDNAIFKKVSGDDLLSLDIRFSF